MNRLTNHTLEPILKQTEQGWCWDVSGIQVNATEGQHHSDKLDATPNWTSSTTAGNKQGRQGHTWQQLFLLEFSDDRNNFFLAKSNLMHNRPLFDEHLK